MTDIILSTQNGEPVASSRQIAENFGKEHRNVMRDVDSLKKDVLNFEQMFFETETPDSYGRPQRTYLMNRDGFSLLVMGFTGKAALEWKLKYIQAFNEMEKKLATPQMPKLSKELQALFLLDDRTQRQEQRITAIPMYGAWFTARSTRTSRCGSGSAAETTFPASALTRPWSTSSAGSPAPTP